MNYKTSGEFVKAHSNKIDEISELFDPKIFRAKDEVQRLSMAGIDFPLIDEGMDEPHEREGESGLSVSTRAGGFDTEAITEAETSTAIGESGRNREDEKPEMGTLCHVLIGNIKVPNGHESEETNTDAGSTQGPVLALNSRYFYGGLDGGTTVSVSGSWGLNGDFIKIDRALEASREVMRPVACSLGGVRCLVSSAPGGGKIHFHCKIEVGGVAVMLHRNPCGTIPAAKIIYPWDVCDRYDLEMVHEHVLLWLQRLGLVRDEEWLSRLDVQVTAGMKLEPFYQCAISGSYRCRIRKPHFNLDGVYPEGVYFGSHKAPIFFRSYDKWREAFGNSQEKCCNLVERFEAADYDVMSNPVTRFEFETHRQVLHALGINTFRDLKENGSGYVAYLCDWIRFLVSKDGRHTERESVLPEWQEVTEMFGTVFSGECPKLQRKSRTTGGNMSEEQYRRTAATVGTLLAKMLLHDCQKNNSEPISEYPQMLQRITETVRPKFNPLYDNARINSSENLLENFESAELEENG